jgi:hypothetical protein
MSEERLLLDETTPMDFMIRTKPGGTWLLLNGSTIHGLVAYKAEQQVGMLVQPPATLTLWVEEAKAGDALRVIKTLKAVPLHHGT